MEPRSWDRIQEIYYSALPIPLGQQCDFVARECDFDPVLTKQICSLLKADASSEFLEAPIFSLGLKLLDRDDSTELSEISDPIDQLIGATIGAGMSATLFGGGPCGSSTLVAAPHEMPGATTGARCLRPQGPSRGYNLKYGR